MLYWWLFCQPLNSTLILVDSVPLIDDEGVLYKHIVYNYGESKGRWSMHRFPMFTPGRIVQVITDMWCVWNNDSLLTCSAIRQCILWPWKRLHWNRITDFIFVSPKQNVWSISVFENELFMILFSKLYAWVLWCQCVACISYYMAFIHYYACGYQSLDAK